MLVTTVVNGWMFIYFIILGVSITTITWYLFGRTSGINIYNKAFDIVDKSDRVLKIIGNPIRSSQFGGGRLANVLGKSIPGVDGTVLKEVRFAIVGPFGEGVVIAHVREEGFESYFDPLVFENLVVEYIKYKPTWIYYQGRAIE